MTQGNRFSHRVSSPGLRKHCRNGVSTEALCLGRRDPGREGARGKEVERGLNDLESSRIALGRLPPLCTPILLHCLP